MSKELLITYQGLRTLEEELEELKTVKRKEVSEKIKVARSFGDLSENSEYDEAKNEQGFVESRIVQLEKLLKNVRVLDEDEIVTDYIGIGSHVLVKNGSGVEAGYDIVGATEADPAICKISDESPIGAALMGHKVGDVILFTVPSGATIQFTVLQISKQKLGN